MCSTWLPTYHAKNREFLVNCRKLGIIPILTNYVIYLIIYFNAFRLIFKGFGLDNHVIKSKLQVFLGAYNSLITVTSISEAKILLGLCEKNVLHGSVVDET